MEIHVSTPLSDLTTAELGRLGEDLATDYLRHEGYRILERNWRVRYGEIDIIAATPTSYLVFVEVKTRRSTSAGIPAAAVTSTKYQRRRQLAAMWMVQKQAHAAGVRIDVISLEARGDHTLVLDHLRSVA